MSDTLVPPPEVKQTPHFLDKLRAHLVAEHDYNPQPTRGGHSDRDILWAYRGILPIARYHADEGKCKTCKELIGEWRPH